MSPRKTSGFSYKEKGFGTLTTHEVNKIPSDPDWQEPVSEPVKKTRRKKASGPERLGRPLTVDERNENKELTTKGLAPKYIR